MPVNSIVVDAPPEAVFEVLSHGERYAEWVLGPGRSRPIDANWPAPGSVLEHRSGIPPLALHDTTSVVSSDPPRRMLLEARVRPLLVATVELAITPHATGCTVRMEERLVGGIARGLPRWITGPLIRRRNGASLQQLKLLVLRSAAGRLSATPNRSLIGHSTLFTGGSGPIHGESFDD
jgi:uncharacterized protein YndB with AHSA1/START domain